MLNVLGPTRLVLINSAVFRYVELDLRGTVHLAGPNNVGKTSLINSFQFFYAGDERMMRFSETLDKSKRFYFRDAYSHLLLEVETASGPMVLGLHATGRPGDRDWIEGYLLHGAYRKDVFIGEDGRVRAWADIELAIRCGDGLLLDKESFRDLVFGAEGGRDSGFSGLVPLGSSGRKGANLDHARRAFSQVFLNMLSLRKTEKEALKRMILGVIGPVFSIPGGRITPALDFGPGYTVNQARGEVFRKMRAMGPICQRLFHEREDLDVLTRHLPTEWRTLVEAGRLAVKTEGERAETLDQEALDAEERKSIRLRQHAEQKAELEKLGLKVGRLSGRVAQIQEGREKLESHPLPLLRAKREALEQEKADLQVTLRVGQGGQAGADIQRRIRQNEDRVALLQRALEKDAPNWYGEVLGQWPAEERDRMVKLLNPELFHVAQVEVLDPEALSRLLEGLERATLGDRFEHYGVRVDLSTLAGARLEIEDPMALQASLEATEAAIEKDRALLEQARDSEKTQKRLRDVQQECDALLSEILQGERIAGELQELPALEQELTELEEARDLARENERHLAIEAEEAKDRARECRQMAGTARRKAESFQQSLLAMERLEPEGGSEAPCPGRAALPQGDTLAARVGTFMEQERRMRELQQSTRQLLEDIEQRLPDRDLLVGSLPERIEALKERMAHLPDEEVLLDKERRALVLQASHVFSNFVRDFDLVRRRITRINQRFRESGIHVSNLQDVKIVVHEDTKLLPLIRKIAWGSEMPLIEGEGRDEAIGELLGQMIQHPEVRLEQMFDLSLEIVQADGTRKAYDSLDAESTGTGITLRLILMSMFLRELLENRQTVRIPIFVDEVDALDDRNRDTILRIAAALGFQVVSASPNGLDVDRCYFLHSVGGKTEILSEETLGFQRPESEEAPVSWTEEEVEPSPAE